jgi:hypothetical protein
VRSRDKGGFAPETLDGVIQTLVDNARSGAELLQKYTPLVAGLMQELQTYLGNELEHMQLQVALARAPIDRSEEDAEKARAVQAATMAQVLDWTSRVSMVLERINKMTMQAVKTKDEATRLRVFLAGDEERGTLDGMSEVALRKLVSDAASGWTSPDGEHSDD